MKKFALCVLLGVLILPASASAEGMIYGTERGPDGGDSLGGIIGIDTTTMFASNVCPDHPTTNGQNWPNGMAYDVVNNRLYYGDSDPTDGTPSDLYFCTPGTDTPAVSVGQVRGSTAGAAFYNGAYYYIANATDNLHIVVMDEVTGLISREISIVLSLTPTYRFGDIAINCDGILYGSATNGTTNDIFSVDLNNGYAFTMIKAAATVGTRQIAFADDGMLYATNAGDGTFATVNLADGTLTPTASAVTSPLYRFTDLASGQSCEPEVVEVLIDIKPQSLPNCFNINGHGVVPVAILGTEEFDVYSVDLNSLEFAGMAVRVQGKKGELQCSYEDVSGNFTDYPTGGPDGYTDLVCQFVDDVSLWTPNDNATASLTGMLLDQTPFSGTDDICITQEVPQ